MLEWGGDLEGRTRGSLFSLKSPTWGSGQEELAKDPLKAREARLQGASLDPSPREVRGVASLIASLDI